MGKETTELRYLELKKELCRAIYEGAYQNGDRILSERQLALKYDMSRITVRKALDIMEEENLIVREVGNGTMVTLKNYGNQAPLDVVALVAPSKNPFFAQFIARFQKCAWEHDSLLLYVEAPGGTSLEDCLYRLYSKDIRSAVVWPDDRQIDAERLLRLRSIGMNLVFFDTDAAHPYADSVLLDNEDAIRSLLQNGNGDKRECLYLGWDNLSIRNIRRREEIFKSMRPDGQVLRIPWRQDRKIEENTMARILERISGLAEGLVLCATGDVGLQVMEALSDSASRTPEPVKKPEGLEFALIDEFSGAEIYPSWMYNQDLGTIAEEIFRQFQRQAEEGTGWKARICPVRGRCFQKLPGGTAANIEESGGKNGSRKNISKGI